ncbi:MAG TPA: hypothetical protein VHB50_11445 [Bryobacteraceae bacterium]|nr:hypothetical protein [Bryobacteraceae bacterium]
MNCKLLAGMSILFAVSALAIDLPKDIDVGVYVTDGTQWLEVPVEIVNWKTGGVLKNLATDGLIKGDMNGRIHGASSPMELSRAVRIEALIHPMEGVSAQEYQLIRFRTHKDAREFRSVTGGIFHMSGGAQRDIVPFKPIHIGPRLWKIDISDLPPGEYAFLPPVNTVSLAGAGKAYTFDMGGCEHCAFEKSNNEGALKRFILNSPDRGMDF